MENSKELQPSNNATMSVLSQDSLEKNIARMKNILSTKDDNENTAQNLLVYANDKAGMSKVKNKQSLKDKIYELTKDSAYFQNEQRKMKQVEERLANVKHNLKSIPDSELKRLTKQYNKKLKDMESER